MKKYIPFLLLLIGLITLGSCKSYEKTVYFQGNANEPIQGAANYNPFLKTDDLLSIYISGDDAESVLPFSGSSGKESTGNQGRTYLIDVNGEITLPIVGKIAVAGKTRHDATSVIQAKLKEYINNPVVSIHIANYKVTVLGDVKTPGTYTITNERITLLEALGLAGDLKMTGNRKNVLVIRDDNGKKTEYRIDMTSKQLFASPAYYLAQNDVIYVEPNNAARTESAIWRATGPMIVSMTTLIVTTINLLIR